MRMLAIAVVTAALAAPTLAQYRQLDAEPKPRCTQVCEYRQLCPPQSPCYPIKKCRQRCSR